jgi:asparagine synthetase B (glutamine-hydrolysing)
MRIRLVGVLDGSFAWDGAQLLGDETLQPDADRLAGVRGAMACASDGPDGFWLARDQLGLNKLFWAPESETSVAVAARPHRLVAEGFPFDRVKAFPRGGVLAVDATGARYRQNQIRPGRAGEVEADPSVAHIAKAIRNAVDAYLAALASARAARVFVCCSGGLDSSGILALATHHFRDIVAVSFDIERPGGGRSEDRQVARRLCRDLNVPLLETNAKPDQLLEHLDTVLVEGCDWRDFNVHAALVNAVLAAGITGEDPGGGIVLTGDLANEFLADYHPETHRGVTYYRLPRLAPTALRNWLVNGLDTVHREIGVFGAWGLTVIQPYAVAVDPYLRLNDELLQRDDAKQQLCREAFGDVLPSYILDRRKVRAQVGGADGAPGVLGLCIDSGIDQPALLSRFARLHRIGNMTALDQFMRAGRYRSAIPFIKEDWQ